MVFIVNVSCYHANKNKTQAVSIFTRSVNTTASIQKLKDDWSCIGRIGSLSPFNPFPFPIHREQTERVLQNLIWDSWDCLRCFRGPPMWSRHSAVAQMFLPPSPLIWRHRAPRTWTLDKAMVRPPFSANICVILQNDSFKIQFDTAPRVCVMDEPKWRPNAWPLRHELRHRERRVYANRDGFSDREQRDVQVWPITGFYFRFLDHTTTQMDFFT